MHTASRFCLHLEEIVNEIPAVAMRQFARSFFVDSYDASRTITLLIGARQLS